jgi:hypothetical protein
MIPALLAAVVLTLGLAACTENFESASFPKTDGPCPVTLPNRTVAHGAGFTAAGFNYGNAHIRADLYWPHGILHAGVLPDSGAFAVINPDGSVSAKLGWWRGLPHKLVIRGHRLDASALPLRADVPDGYGAVGFQPSGVTFPTVGCWRVVGKLGSASLTFVVKVTKLKPTTA